MYTGAVRLEIDIHRNERVKRKGDHEEEEGWTIKRACVFKKE